MANRPSRLVVSIPDASGDGKYYGRYPLGNAPVGTNPGQLAGTPADVSSASGALTVVSSLNIVTTSVPNATEGAAYSTQLVSNGGYFAPGYTNAWEITTGLAALEALGFSFNTNTAFITGTPTGTGSVALVAQVTDSNGNVDTQALNLTVVAPSGIVLANLNYPRWWARMISPQASIYNPTSFLTALSYYNGVSLNNYISMEKSIGYFGGTANTTLYKFFTALQAASLALGAQQAILTGLYYMSSEASEPGGSGSGDTYLFRIANLNANKQWLYTSWPSGTPVQQDSGSYNILFAINGSNQAPNCAAGNITAGGSNPVIANPLAGMTVHQADAQYYADGFINGLFYSKYGERSNGLTATAGNAANPLCQFFDWDNVFSGPRQAGAYGETTTSYGALGSGGTGPATAGSFMQKGQAAQAAAMRAAAPAGTLIYANCDYFLFGAIAGEVALDPSQEALWDIEYNEQVIGNTNSAAKNHSFLTVWNGCIASEAMFNATGIKAWHALGTLSGTEFPVSIGSWTSAEYMVVRNAAAWCAMRGYATVVGNYETAFNFDEQFQADAAGTQVPGWLQQPLGTSAGLMQTAPYYSNGAYRRDFVGGIALMLPYDAPSAVTITDSSLSTLYRCKPTLNGGSNTANTGAVVGSSLTLQPGDGIFLKRSAN